MVGGNLADIRMPHPDGSFTIYSKCFDMAASKSNFIVDEQLVPVGFKCESAEFCADAVTEAAGITVAVADDTGTPKILVNDVGIAAITAGASARAALTVDKTKEIYGGALLRFWYDSGAGDSATNCQIRLHCVPLHGNKERLT